MAFDYFRHVKGSRFSIGGEISMAMYTDFNYKGTIPSGQTISIYEEDCFWTAHGEVRYHFYQSQAIKTYFQARLGATTFFSSLQSNDPNVTYNKFQTHGTAFNTGVGLGMMINVDRVFGKDHVAGRTYIDLGAGLHSGTSTTYRYVTRDQNIPLDQGRYRSLTDYLDFRLGLITGAPWQ